MKSNKARFVATEAESSREARGADGDDRSVKIISLEAATNIKIKWLVLSCIEAILQENNLTNNN